MGGMPGYLKLVEWLARRPQHLTADGTFSITVAKHNSSAPVGLELPILALNPGLSNVARRRRSVLR